jgi:hypothetical protein
MWDSQQFNEGRERNLSWYSEGTQSDEFLEDQLGVFRRMPESQYRHYLGWGLWFYDGTFFPALQMIWAVQHGQWPWEPTADPGVRERQPVIEDQATALGARQHGVAGYRSTGHYRSSNVGTSARQSAIRPRSSAPARSSERPRRPSRDARRHDSSSRSTRSVLLSSPKGLRLTTGSRSAALDHC